MLDVVMDFFLNFHSKILPLTSKQLTRGNIYCCKLRKTFGNFFRSYSEIVPKVVLYRVKNMIPKDYR